MHVGWQASSHLMAVAKGRGLVARRRHGDVSGGANNVDFFLNFVVVTLKCSLCDIHIVVHLCFIPFYVCSYVLVKNFLKY